MTSVESVLPRCFFLIPHCVILPQPSHRHIVQLIMRFRLFSPLWCSAHLSVSKPMICRSTYHKHSKPTIVRQGKYQERMKWQSIPYWYSVSLYCQCRGHHDILATTQKELNSCSAQRIHKMCQILHWKCMFCVGQCWKCIEYKSLIRPVSRVWRRFPGELLSTIRSRGWGGETSSLSLPVWSGCQDLFRWFLSTIEEKYQ